MPGQDIDTIAGQVPVRINGVYETTVYNLSVRRNRPSVQRASATGRVMKGKGVAMYSFTFKRPALEDSSTQIPPEVLEGDFYLEFDKGDQTYRLTGCSADDSEMSNDPAQGSTDENFSGKANGRKRIK